MVIGENKTFLGGESYLRQRGVEVVVVDDAECKALMDKFIDEKPELWSVLPRDLHQTCYELTCCRNEDIGVEERVYSKEGIKTQ